jgi:hypothetical protein
MLSLLRSRGGIVRDAKPYGGRPPIALNYPNSVPVRNYIYLPML